MATRTVRLDDEAERALEDVRELTGLPISEVLKQGLRVLQKDVRAAAGRTPYAIFQELDLGPGGHAVGAAGDAKSAVRAALRKKHGR